MELNPSEIPYLPAIGLRRFTIEIVRWPPERRWPVDANSGDQEGVGVWDDLVVQFAIRLLHGHANAAARSLD
jgi:hypothetical protein